VTSPSSDRDRSAAPRISSFCSDGDCVGVSIHPDGVDVVDTGTAGRLSFTTSEWTAFVAGVKNGEFDLA